MKAKHFFICLIFLAACAEDIKEKNQGLKTAAELSKLLPAEILGFKATKQSKDEDIRDRTPGFQRVFAVTEQVYYKGKDSLCLRLHDFKEAPTYYTIYSGLWSANEKDTNGMQSSYVSYGPEIKGWVIYDQPHDCTSASIGIYDRFYLSLDYYGKNDPGFAKEAVNTFDFKQLEWY